MADETSNGDVQPVAEQTLRVNIRIEALIAATAADTFLKQLLDDQPTEDVADQWGAFRNGFREGFYGGMYIADMIAGRTLTDEESTTTPAETDDADPIG